MNLLTMKNVTKFYSEKMLLDDIDFSIHDTDKIGVIGINGTGKSTLLKLIAGAEETDEGTIVYKNNIKINYLPQNPQFDLQDTVLSSITSKQEILENHSRETIEAEAKSLLTRLGVTDFEEPVAHLSGGQKKRLALVQTLLSDAELLILDEPTNHLDSSMADWLEQTLKKSRSAIIMVTHDRYFLDSVANKILEIDHGKVYLYETNYVGYLQRKAEREESLLASERKRKSILKVELAWMMRGARARSTKQKAHIARYEALKAQKAPQIGYEQVDMIAGSVRMGKTTIELTNVCKGYGDKKLLDDFTYTFTRNDRVGFVGENGCGKSTLIKMMIGEIEPDAGQIIRGQTIKIGYFAQDETHMDDNLRVIDYVRERAEILRTNGGEVITASQMLERFLFPREMQYQKLEKLSGGEKRRLYLLRVLMEAPNVLVLDEPTNNLDIKPLTILEDYLDAFDGIVITVSHDRYFLDRVVRRIFAFENGVLQQYEGGYTDYQAKREDDAESVQAAEKKSSEKNTSASMDGWKNNREKKLKFTFQEQRDYQTIEEKIGELEEELNELEKEIVSAATNYPKLRELTEKKEKLQAELDEKTERFFYLEELAEKIKEQNQKKNL